MALPCRRRLPDGMSHSRQAGRHGAVRTVVRGGRPTRVVVKLSRRARRVLHAGTGSSCGWRSPRGRLRRHRHEGEGSEDQDTPDMTAFPALEPELRERLLLDPEAFDAFLSSTSARSRRASTGRSSSSTRSRTRGRGPRRSYLLASDGEVRATPRPRTAPSGRHPILAFGSNAAPSTLHAQVRPLRGPGATARSSCSPATCTTSTSAPPRASPSTARCPRRCSPAPARGSAPPSCSPRTTRRRS